MLQATEFQSQFHLFDRSSLQVPFSKVIRLEIETDHLVLGPLPYRSDWPERVLMIPNFFHLWTTEAPWIFNSVEPFLYLSQISASMQSCLGEVQTIPWLSWLGLCSDRNRQVCVFANHVPTTEFTTGGLWSTRRNTWKMISGNRMHLNSILSAMAKAENSYICYIFDFLFFLSYKNFKQTFSVCHYAILGVEFWVEKWIKPILE